MSSLQSGIVKWFDSDKGFGFIDNPTGPDIFLHYSQIEAEGYRTVEKNERVFYELRNGPRGLYAARVSRTHIPTETPIGTPPGIRKVYHLILKDQLEESDSLSKGSTAPLLSLSEAALSAHRF